MNSSRSVAPTLVTLAIVLAAALAATFQITLGFRTLTGEGVRRLRVAAAPATVSPLRVIDPGGNPRALWDADTRTRVWLVTFVYTSCPTVCLALGSEFQQLQASIRADDGLRLASISFDRGHDTPAALAAYAKRFRADPARWLVGVPDSGPALSRLLREAGVVVIDDGAGGYVHNAAIHVITPDGRLVALYDLDHYREALEFARRLSR